MMEHYYISAHPEYRSLPPVRQVQNESAGQTVGMKFLYPQEGSVIRLPRYIDGTRGQLTCSVAHSDSSIELFWHCDNHYVGSTKELHTITLDLAPGVHMVSVVASNGEFIGTSFNII